MVTYVNEFKLEVTTTALIPHVRVSLKNGTVVVDTKAVSVTGLERLSEVFEEAASTALQQLEYQYRLRSLGE
jgi:hypothetical protein